MVSQWVNMFHHMCCHHATTTVHGTYSPRMSFTPLKQRMALMIHKSLAFLFTLQIWKFCIKYSADINFTTHNCLAVIMSSLHLPTEEVQLCELCVHYNKIHFHNNIFSIYPNLPMLSCQHTADGDVPLDWVVCCYPFDDMADSHCLVNGHQSLG